MQISQPSLPSPYIFLFYCFPSGTSPYELSKSSSTEKRPPLGAEAGGQRVPAAGAAGG